MAAFTRDQLYAFFRAVDKDGSGKIDAGELAAALSAQGYQFKRETAGMILRQFDVTGTSTIEFAQFEALNAWILACQQAFGASDTDRSGVVETKEIPTALRAAGYNPSDMAINILLRRMQFGGLYTEGPPNGLTFPQFMDVCAFLALGRTAFSWYDGDRDGTATLTIAQLFEILLVLKP
eukprot:a677241_113.p1 GENE.a677241_113~~a677241_113.p1  ORF type:complete len:195 (-),score=58.73 a677241_113:25-561(-)